MATVIEKSEYHNLVGPIKRKNEALDRASKKYLAKLNGIDINEKPIEFAKTKLNYINLMLQQTNNLMQISKISVKKLSIKNEAILNQARKNIHTIIGAFEDVVGNEIDRPLKENEARLLPFKEVIGNLSRFELFKQIGFLINVLESAYGEDSKWKWNFIDLEGRMITALKNFISFQELIRNLDPTIEGFPERMEIIDLISKKIEKAAERYRYKYELTNKQIEYMRTALAFISFNKQLAILLGNSEEAEKYKKKIDIWNKKLNEDIRLQEKNNSF